MIGVTVSIAFITLWFVALAFVIYRQSNQIGKIEEIQLKQIASAAEAKKDADQRIDNIITVHNSSIEHYDSEIDQIITRLNEITADIARMDQMTAQDHRDLVDIRERYVLYREPTTYRLIQNGGVDWAPESPTQEDEHE